MDNFTIPRFQKCHKYENVDIKKNGTNTMRPEMWSNSYSGFICYESKSLPLSDQSRQLSKLNIAKVPENVKVPQWKKNEQYTDTRKNVPQQICNAKISSKNWIMNKTKVMWLINMCLRYDTKSASFWRLITYFIVYMFWKYNYKKFPPIIIPS